MQRREALRLLMAGGVLPALPTNLFAFFQGAHPASGYTLRTLNPHQNDTVVAMIDQIITGERARRPRLSLGPVPEASYRTGTLRVTANDLQARGPPV